MDKNTDIKHTKDEILNKIIELGRQNYMLKRIFKKKEMENQNFLIDNLFLKLKIIQNNSN